MSVLGEAAFGAHVHRYHLREIEDSEVVYTYGGQVPWPPEAGPRVPSQWHALRLPRRS